MMHKGCVVVMVAALVGYCYGEMVKVTNRRSGSLTCSTLEWVDMQAGHTPPPNALPISEDGPLWCRARQHATWMSGAVENGSCRVPFIKQAFDIKEFEVLVSINDSARVIPVEWDSLQALPLRAITLPKMVLAIAKNDEGQVMPGYVNPNKRRAYLLKDGKYHEQASATVLTEDEPVRYKVDHVVRDEERSHTYISEEVVSKINLTNSEEEEQLVTEMLDYTAKEIIYWGRVRGTVSGLETTVIDPSGNVREITWAIENELDQVLQEEVKFELPPGTGVDVDLIAVTRKYEAPYSAKLTAIYADQERRSRTISGLHIHTHLTELRANFSQPYYLSNSTKLEGEFLTSQILIHSTTTTTTTTTTPSPDVGSTLDDEKPQSDSLATTDVENQLPTAQEVGSSDTATAAVPGLVSLCCSLLLAFQLLLRH